VAGFMILIFVGGAMASIGVIAETAPVDAFAP
jgi:hypothetical protein